ncbi:hypothetical protein H3Z28_002324 [Salmonella enterica subsp. enterica serovar Ank]|nr:hypothetical protein [Salmonella enterica subsp. enterica serovar Ank]
MSELMKNFDVNKRKYSIVKMDAFNIVHFNLRFAELLTAHNVTNAGSLQEAGARLFSVLNRAEHDELLFWLLSQSQAQIVGDTPETTQYLSDWDTVNYVLPSSDVADLYSVALECLKFSILPALEQLKKNTGLAVTVNPASMLSDFLRSLATKLKPNSPSGE